MKLWIQWWYNCDEWIFVLPTQALLQMQPIKLRVCFKILPRWVKDRLTANTFILAHNCNHVSTLNVLYQSNAIPYWGRRLLLEQPTRTSLFDLLLSWSSSKKNNSNGISKNVCIFPLKSDITVNVNRIRAFLVSKFLLNKVCSL